MHWMTWKDTPPLSDNKILPSYHQNVRSSHAYHHIPIVKYLSSHMYHRTCTVTHVPSHISPHMYLHTYRRTRTVTHVPSHMYRHTCVIPHVSSHMYRHTCTITHVPSHMYRHTTIQPSLSPPEEAARRAERHINESARRDYPHRPSLEGSTRCHQPHLPSQASRRVLLVIINPTYPPKLVGERCPPSSLSSSYRGRIRPWFPLCRLPRLLRVG